MKKTFTKNLQRIIVASLVVCMLVSCLVVFAGCNKTTQEEYHYKYEAPIYNKTNEAKKAIIILPGILGSNLINAQTNEPVWSGGALMNNLFMTRDRLTMNQIIGFFNTFMGKDKNGNAITPVRAANMNDQYLQYGLIDEYRNLYKYFNNNYGANSKLPDKDKYDVMIYQYDWTKSALDSALELEQFIKANKYEQNILVGHSLGGVVIDYYLTKEENRQNTDGFISLGTPHYGAVDTLLMAFASTDLALGDLPSILDLLGIKMEDLSYILESMGGLNLENKLPLEFKDDAIKFATTLTNEMLKMVRKMPSIYDLLPSEELFNDNNIKINGTPVSYNDFVAKVQLIPSVKDNPAVLNAFNTAINNRKSLYIGTEKTFVSDVLGYNSFYIAGNGKKETQTTVGLNFTIAEDNSFNIKPNKDNITRGTSFKENKVEIDGQIYVNYLPNYVGDSMVLVKSATLGKSMDELNVHYLKGFYDHIDLYSPVSIKDGSHFLPIMEPNEIGEALKEAMDTIRM